MMNDMRPVIVPKSDQTNSDDLIGGPITITISGVSIRPGTEQPISVHFTTDGGKPYKPCKSMARVMVHCWGPDANEYVGRRMTLYCDPKVTWGGLAVGGIRISHMSDLDSMRTMVLTATKGSRKPFTVKPLETAPTRVATTRTPRHWLSEWEAQVRDALAGPSPQADVDAIFGSGEFRKAEDLFTNGALERLNQIKQMAFTQLAEIQERESADETGEGA